MVRVVLLMLFTSGTLVVSGFCLKIRPVPFVWFWLNWVCAMFGLIFYVHGSWPRALLFNAGVAAATLAGVEAYLAANEREPPKHSSGWLAHDKASGFVPISGTRARVTRTERGRQSYDVTYTIDENGLRIAPPASTEPVGTVLFFGCSFTFGDGVEDDETLPYQVGLQSEGRWHTFNFAPGGQGPQYMLAALEGGRVGADGEFAPSPRDLCGDRARRSAASQNASPGGARWRACWTQTEILVGLAGSVTRPHRRGFWTRSVRGFRHNSQAG